MSPVILCVDDEPFSLKLLESMLEPTGCRVIEANDGLEALEIIGTRKIDLVLTDVVMPGVDGFETCRRIKGDERYRHIPVVMVTALGSKADRIVGIEAGADDFLCKPFDHSEVLARVKVLLRTRQLDAMLEDSYSNILDLTSFGSEMLSSFHPAGFDLMSQIDRLANQMIRKDPQIPGRPKTMLVRIPGHEWVWHRYAYLSGRLEKSSCYLNAPLDISERGASAYNNLRSLPELSSLVESLDFLGIDCREMVSYLSGMVCIFALDYGRNVTPYDAAVLENLAMQTLFFMQLAAQIGEREDAFFYTVRSLARAAEANDEDTGDHIMRVGEYCAILAKKLGQPEGYVESIRVQAVLHDVGKVHIPTEIQKKPGRLDPEEREIMKRHTVMGAKIIGNHPKFEIARRIALSHHERWDGTG
jgi:putative nucleotidyltransferase with HDIG domain